MKIKNLCALLCSGAIFLGLISCGKDDDKPACDTFSPADSVCFCQQNPESGHCKTLHLTISLVTEKKVVLTPHSSNGTLWCKGFAIGKSVYLIDRESDAPQAFWKYALDGADEWVALADFPGDDNAYGLTGSANGKGYASRYASTKFWEYDPGSNQWNPMADLPFSTGETHWVEYKGKYYVPHHNGIYEFNAITKEWTKFSNETSSGFGAVFLIDDDMYWYNINNDFMNHFNFVAKSFENIDLPDEFGSSIVFNSPFVLQDQAYVISSDNLWVFDNESKTWVYHADALVEGSSYPDDVFVLDGKAYLIDNGALKIFE